MTRAPSSGAPIVRPGLLAAALLAPILLAPALLLLVLLLQPLPAAAAKAPAPNPRSIQIGIVQAAPEVMLEPAGDCVLTAPDGVLAEVPGGRRYKLVPADAGHARLGGVRVPSGSRLTSKEAGAAVKIGPYRYAGSLIIRRNADGTLHLVEEVDMEQYLLGVLPQEMEADWPLEALKAQAVVARTFGYYNLGRYRTEGFDLGPDTKSQVYKGLGYDNDRVRLAVSSTKDEVLGFKGRILNAFYHSCCGGHTTSPNKVWGSWVETPRPLRGVKDRYCGRCPHSRWSAYFQDGDVLAALSDRTLLGVSLETLSVGRRDAAGFAQDLRIYGSEPMKIDAKGFRLRLGPKDLKSLKILRIVRRSNGIEFVGSGLGHGVGMCQWGARFMAEHGRNYEEILSYYFPGSTLSVVE